MLPQAGKAMLCAGDGRRARCCRARDSGRFIASDYAPGAQEDAEPYVVRSAAHTSCFTTRAYRYHAARLAFYLP